MKNDGSHLSLSQRQIIETGIINQSSKTAIAETIGKDKSTVAKEMAYFNHLGLNNVNLNIPVFDHLSIPDSSYLISIYVHLIITLFRLDVILYSIRVSLDSNYFCMMQDSI